MSRRGFAFALVLGIAASACGGASARPVVERPPVAPPLPATCSAFGELALGDTPSPLLGDRLRIRMPRGAEPETADEARAPMPPVVLESVTAIHAAEGEALRVRAIEMLRRRGEGSLEEEVERFLGVLGADARVEALEGLTDLEGVLVLVPAATFARTGEIARAIVHGDDGALMSVGFSVSASVAAEGDRASCIAMARRLASTLTAGERRLALDGGTVALPHGLALDIPPGYVGVRYAGADFEAQYFFPLSPLGGPQAQLGVYVGRDPASHVGDVLSIRRAEGALLGRPATWQLWTSADRGERMFHREAMVEIEGAPETWAHVFVTAPDEESVRAMAAIVETLHADAR